MLKITKERANSLARLLLDELSGSETLRLLREPDAVRQAISHALFDEFRRDQDLQAAVRDRIASMKNAPALNSREWDALFRKTLDEEYENANGSE
jgi:hypothetical protein